MADIKLNFYTDKEGLNSNFVTSISQDSLGYIWVGTLNGLNRFDGKNFKTFVHQENDPTSLGENMVSDILPYQGNELCIATSNGLSIYNPNSHTFKNHKFDTTQSNSIYPGSKNYSKNYLRSLALDRDGTIWCGTFFQGLIAFDPIKQKTKQYKFSAQFGDYLDTLFTNEINDIYLQPGTNYIWITTGSGLLKFNKKTGEHTWVKETLGKLTSSIAVESPNVIWVAGLGLGKLDLNTGKWLFSESDGVGGNQVTAMIFDSDKLWLTYGDSGIRIFNIHTGQSQNYFKNLGKVDGQRRTLYFKMFKDRDGSIWFAQNSGLARFSYEAQQIQYISFMGNMSFFNRFVKTGNTYLAGSSGIDGTTLVEFDLNKGLVSAPYCNEKMEYRHPERVDSRILAGSPKGIYEFNQKTKKYQKFDMAVFGFAELNEEDIQYAYRLPDNRLFVSTLTQGFYYEKAPRVLKSISIPNAQLQPINPNDTGKMYVRVRYYSGKSAIAKFDLNTEKWTTLIDTNTLQEYSPFALRTFAIDRNKNIWIQFENSLHFINMGGQIDKPIKKFTKQLLSQVGKFYTGILTPDQYFYATSSAGLFRINAINFQIEHFNTNHGLLTNDLLASVKIPEKNLMMMGTDNGVYVFRHNDLKLSTKIPTLVFTSFKVNGHERNGNPDYLKQLSLKWDERNFAVAFSALCYSNYDACKYAYMLEGYKNKWDTTATPQVNFTNLPAGNYVFKVACSNSDGTWSKNQRTIQIHISAPFWQTWWFYVLMIGVASFVVYSIFKWQLRLVRKEEGIKSAFNKKMAEAEMVALRAQMNPHFIFNCLNSINGYIVKNDPFKASDYLSKFSKLIRLILDNSRQAKVPLQNEVEAIKIYIEMEALRFSRQFSYDIEIGSNVDVLNTRIPPMILQPFVENSIWHGLMHSDKAGKLTISIEETEEFLQCVIEDNGAGRKKAAERKAADPLKNQSHGMNITLERIKQAYPMAVVEIVDLYDENNYAKGTRVLIKLPN